MTMATTAFHGVQTRSFRIFKHARPAHAARDGPVVPNFIAQAFKNEPITVYGDGSQTRSFCYVSDLVEGIVRPAALRLRQGPVNLGNPGRGGDPAVRRAHPPRTGRRARSSPGRSEDDPKVSSRTSAGRRKLLGWEPKVGLDDGLKKDDRVLQGRV
jgi:dTDP-glucose 4,6-dehydratase